LRQPTSSGEWQAASRRRRSIGWAAPRHADGAAREAGHGQIDHRKVGKTGRRRQHGGLKARSGQKGGKSASSGTGSAPQGTQTGNGHRAISISG
jgi:hypothetical protein